MTRIVAAAGCRVAVYAPFDAAFTAALREVAARARWSPSRRAYVVDVGLDYGCAGPVLRFAAERAITVEPAAAAMLARQAQRQADTTAAHVRARAELAAWNAQPSRPLAEVRRVVGPIVFAVDFPCSACEARETAWATAGPFRVAVHHLPTIPGPQRITEDELADLLGTLRDPRGTGASSPLVCSSVTVPAPAAHSASAPRRSWRLRRVG